MNADAIIHTMRLCQTPVNKALSFAKQLRLKQQRHQFNITSTYASFSDVPTPYFTGVCRNADVVDRRMTSIGDRLLSKDRAVAWFVTHCSTSSKRERYNIAQCLAQQTHLSRRSSLVSSAELLRAVATLLPNTSCRWARGAVQKLSECHLNYDAHGAAACALGTTSERSVMYPPIRDRCRHVFPFLPKVTKPYATDVFYESIQQPVRSSDMQIFLLLFVLISMLQSVDHALYGHQPCSRFVLQCNI